LLEPRLRGRRAERAVDPTQDELEALHYASFCEGPAAGGPPWVISGDTGIHPSATGYAQMASQVPAP
jgi:hypothetical protein